MEEEEWHGVAYIQYAQLGVLRVSTARGSKEQREPGERHVALYVHPAGGRRNPIFEGYRL